MSANGKAWTRQDSLEAAKWQTSEPPASVRVGEFVLTRLSNGQLFLNHAEAGGMVCDEKRLAKCLEQFFRKEF